ncbi:unnamed protein product [Meloidogyne enterolobii]|uniref:Uncharacterized protein n=1 Tax=Meloidogyne enterolobii TaxID=390850 RepID=A0ACB0XWI7_MELEN
MTVPANCSRKGIGIIIFEKASTIIRMYLCPFVDFGNGPIKSAWILWNGLPAGSIGLIGSLLWCKPIIFLL